MSFLIMEFNFPLMNRKLKHLFKLVFLLSLMHGQLGAQTKPAKDSTDYHKIRFIVKGGMNTNLIAAKNLDHEVFSGHEKILHRLCNIQPQLSYTVGLGFEYFLNKHLSIQTGINLFHNKMSMNYQHRTSRDANAFSTIQKGIFQQDQLYLQVPVLVAYSFGERINWRIGTGLFLTSAKNIWGDWSQLTFDGEAAETCDHLSLSERSGSDPVHLPWRSNNVGFLLNAQMAIPLRPNIDFLFSGQYHQEIKPLPAPSISKNFLFLETGFRFKIKRPNDHDCSK